VVGKIGANAEVKAVSKKSKNTFAIRNGLAFIDYGVQLVNSKVIRNRT
jgi:hypothetical protein